MSCILRFIFDVLIGVAAIGDVCGIDYLRKSLKYMIDRFNGQCLLFIVCSDDMKWTQSRFPVLLSNVTVSDSSSCQPEVAFSVNRTAAQDLAILSGCNHTVITIGTYGWWAAYLAGGVTVYCDKYPPSGKIPLMVRQDDLYLPTWKGLS
jgi:galactoside 2-L-fucosyltransferase 1/2